MVVRGMKTRARMLRVMVIWMYYNGVGKMVVDGINLRVPALQVVATWMCCNGVEKMDVHGMQNIVLE